MKQAKRLFASMSVIYLLLIWMMGLAEWDVYVLMGIVAVMGLFMIFD